jgi:hypothetical protein
MNWWVHLVCHYLPSSSIISILEAHRVTQSRFSFVTKSPSRRCQAFQHDRHFAGLIPCGKKWSTSQISPCSEGRVTDAALEKYRDFEGLRDEHINLSPSASILFKPLHPDILQNHSVGLNAIDNAGEQTEVIHFRDYDPPTDPEELRRGFPVPLCSDPLFSKDWRSFQSPWILQDQVSPVSIHLSSIPKIRIKIY